MPDENKKKLAEAAEAETDYTALLGERGVQGDFTRKDSLQGQVYGGGGEGGEKGMSEAQSYRDHRSREAANDTNFRRDAEASNDHQYASMEEEVARAREIARQTIARKQQVLRAKHAAGLAHKARGLSGLARWAGIGVAGTAYFWQLLAAAVSLIGFGAWGAYNYAVNDTVVGKVVNAVVGVFFDLESIFPAKYIAMSFWAIATMIAVCMFIGFTLWFHFTGAQMFRSTVSILTYALVFACCILPVANLFPAVLLWVVYVNLMTTIASIRPLVDKASTMGGV